METFLLFLAIFLTVLSIIGIIYVLFTTIVLNNDKLYCKVYLNKQWKLWEKVIENLKVCCNTIYVYKCDENPKLNNYRINIEIDENHYQLNYWPNIKTVGLFNEKNECVLCGFDKYHVEKAIEIMEQKIDKALKYADDECIKLVNEIRA